MSLCDGDGCEENDDEENDRNDVEDRSLGDFPHGFTKHGTKHKKFITMCPICKKETNFIIAEECFCDMVLEEEDGRDDYTVTDAAESNQCDYCDDQPAMCRLCATSFELKEVVNCLILTQVQKAFNEIDDEADAIRKEKELREKEERETSARIREKVDKCEFYKRVNAMYHPGKCTNPSRSGNEDGSYRHCLVTKCPLFA